jgi:hypothetical protein
MVVLRIDERIVAARFLEEDKERVLQLAHGAAIALQGEIHEISEFMVQLLPKPCPPIPLPQYPLDTPPASLG